MNHFIPLIMDPSGTHQVRCLFVPGSSHRDGQDAVGWPIGDVATE